MIISHWQFGRRTCAAGTLVFLSALLFSKAECQSAISSTVYINKFFEVRDQDAPTKYIFNGETRVTHVTGSPSTNVRVQRLRVYPGWNVCSLAITATNAVSQLLTVNSLPVVDAAYKWTPAISNWQSVAVNETLPAGTVLWLKRPQVQF